MVLWKKKSKEEKEYEKNQKTVSYAIVLFTVKRDCHCQFQPVPQSWTKKSISLNVGKTYILKASGTKGKITWTSSKKSVATVSSKGVVKAVGNGTATITVKAKDGSGKKATCKITVGTTNTTPTYKKVELTLDNWQDYIEKIEIPYYATNALENWSLEVTYYYIIKPEYMPYLDMEKSSVVAEVEKIANSYFVTIDFPNKKYTLSEPLSSKNELW
mgnify:CR=1 FL=1